MPYMSFGRFIPGGSQPHHKQPRKHAIYAACKRLWGRRQRHRKQYRTPPETGQHTDAQKTFGGNYHDGV